MRCFAITVTALVLAGVLVMGGCGQKGDLYRDNSATPETAEEDEEG
ncbi:hypothetical protein DES49_0429 [Halospina denitrificans]|uniref:Lipoprotein n=1 Tax=Halospina denitrificans TaxID=332522 RepID=A0A4R7K2P3_9GAMM|nr:lipoprotein [Halospina denitrificans]TDT44327.1 hypothetical protein DES49_0429 [Halospina denitrificans]